MNKYQFWSIVLFSGFLSACTNTQALKTENNNATIPLTQEAASPAASPAISPAVTPANSSAVTAQNAQLIYIAPVIGAPANIVTPLSQRLNQTAQARGLTLSGNENGPSTHVLKGYFSALADEGQTTVLYVWDVLDGSGNRLHRIQGEQKMQGTSADSWGAVTPAALEAIADQTIQQYLNWKNTTKPR